MSETAIAAVASVLSATIAAYASVKAKRVERNTRPISNGFASTVKTSLTALDSHLKDVHDDVRELRKSHLRHLEDHD
jgi:hypothetical protein